MTGLLTPPEVESEILRRAKRLDKVTAALAKRARAAAEADVAWKIAHARALLAAEGTVAEREAHALLACEQEYGAHRLADAVLLSAQEAGRNGRAQLDALRSVNVNLRALVERGGA